MAGGLIKDFIQTVVPGVPAVPEVPAVDGYWDYVEPVAFYPITDHYSLYMDIDPKKVSVFAPGTYIYNYYAELVALGHGPVWESEAWDLNDIENSLSREYLVSLFDGRTRVRQLITFSIGGLEAAYQGYVEPIALVPAVPAIPESYIESRNDGWNTWARSIDPLELGEYLSMTIPVGIDEIKVVIGPQNSIGNLPDNYRFVMSISGTVVQVEEYGTVVSSLDVARTVDTELRVTRQPDGRVAFMAIRGSNSLLFIADGTYIPSNIYCFAFIKDTGDSILSADISPGYIVFGSA